MKKIAYIVGGLAFFFVASLIGIVLYLVTTTETERNRKKTSAARDARWKEREPISNLNTEEEINKALDELNDLKKTNPDIDENKS